MVLSALLIGLAGSLHCAGMCSPLVAAVSGLSRRAWLNRFLYNTGRILTYGLLGAMVGAFGALAGLTSYQAALSVIMGVGLVLLGISGVSSIRIPLLTAGLQQLTIRLKTIFGNLTTLKGGGAMLMMGSVNGLLPCGLTYFALTYCIALPGAWQGFAFMTLFGVGTLPVMVGIPFVLSFFSRRLSLGMRHATTIILIVLGSLLVIRSAWIQPGQNPSAAQASEVVCP